MVEDDLKPRYCLSCNYDLRASTDCCPECGRKFDPADRSSFSLYPRRVRLRRWIRRIVVGASCLLLILGAAAGELWREWNAEQRALNSLQAFSDFSYSILPARLDQRLAKFAQRVNFVSLHFKKDDPVDLKDVEALTQLRSVVIGGGNLRPRQPRANFKFETPRRT